MERFERLIGRPYVEPFGCFAMVREALAMQGVELPDFSDRITEEGKAAVLLTLLDLYARPVENPERGDIVAIRVLGHPAHVGLYLGRGEMLHASRIKGVCLERLSAAAWRGRIHGYYRVDRGAPGSLRSPERDRGRGGERQDPR